MERLLESVAVFPTNNIRTRAEIEGETRAPAKMAILSDKVVEWPARTATATAITVDPEPMAPDEKQAS